jgi:hypothetical protein
MSRLSAVFLGSLSICVPICVLTACNDEEPADAGAATVAEQTTAADCEGIIPSDTIATLGWTGDSGATYSVRGCERRADQGYIEVRELAVPSGNDAQTAVQTEFAARCAEYDTSPDPDSSTEEPATGMLVTWLGDVTACAVEPDGGIGLTKVLLVTPSSGLVQLWVAAFEPTDQDLVRDAVAELADVASTET